jgi:hypothetical protein
MPTRRTDGADLTGLDQAALLACVTLGRLVLGEIRARLEGTLPEARLERGSHGIEAVEMLVLGAPRGEAALATQSLVASPSGSC